MKSFCRRLISAGLHSRSSLRTLRKRRHCFFSHWQRSFACCQQVFNFSMNCHRTATTTSSHITAIRADTYTNHFECNARNDSIDSSDNKGIFDAIHGKGIQSASKTTSTENETPQKRSRESQPFCPLFFGLLTITSPPGQHRIHPPAKDGYGTALPCFPAFSAIEQKSCLPLYTTRPDTATPRTGDGKPAASASLLARCCFRRSSHPPRQTSTEPPDTRRQHQHPPPSPRRPPRHPPPLHIQ